jgi:hypothetical protein
VEIAGVDAVTGPGGTGGVERDGEGIDGLGAVQAVVVGLAAEIGGRGVAPSVIHDLLMWATALTFSIRSTYRHSVARLERFLTQDRRASAANMPPAAPATARHRRRTRPRRTDRETDPDATAMPPRPRRADLSGTGLDTPPCSTLR